MPSAGEGLHRGARAIGGKLKRRRTDQRLAPVVQLYGKTAATRGVARIRSRQVLPLPEREVRVLDRKGR